jgi:hypothetical protein
MMMRRLVAALMLTGIAAGGMWACGSDSYSDGPAGTIDVTELVSGYMRLNANGTYLRSHTYRTTRYTIDGHAIDEVTTFSTAPGNVQRPAPRRALVSWWVGQRP